MTVQPCRKLSKAAAVIVLLVGLGLGPFVPASNVDRMSPLHIDRALGPIPLAKPGALEVASPLISIRVTMLDASP